MRTFHLSIVVGLAAIFSVAPAFSSVAAAATSKKLYGQHSYVIRSEQVEVAVTRLGGHMAPVTFYRDSRRPVQPYHVTPWQIERATSMPAPVLVPLRGDFFCLPFGANTEEVEGEKHIPHGEVSSEPWKLVGSRRLGNVTSMTLAMETKVRPGRVTKELLLIDGQDAVYSQHILTGFSGRMPLGHHATLVMPEQEGTVRIATSPLRFGMTCSSIFSDPKNGEYQALLPGAKWNDLTNVPVAWKDALSADLTRMPARYGFADLVQAVNDPDKSGNPAWTTATYVEEGFIWYALKDPAVLNSTVFWMENHGRHGRPWNGRNNCLGLEDVTACFADGLAAATRENPLTRAGVATAVELNPRQPTQVNYIQGVVKIPPGFENVQTLEFGPGKVTFISTTGRRVEAAVRHEFLKSGKL